MPIKLTSVIGVSLVGELMSIIKFMGTVREPVEPVGAACVSYAAGSAALNVQFSIELDIKLTKEIARMMSVLMG